MSGRGSRGHAVAIRSTKYRITGLILAIGAAILWGGLGGVGAQVLFQRYSVDPFWLVTMRMVGGGLMLAVMLRRSWPRTTWRWLLPWSVFGIAGSQLLWFLAIGLLNAAVATFIQYSYVALVAGWQMTRGEIGPTLPRLAAIAASAGGVALLVLGDPALVDGARFNPLGVVLACSSAASTAFMFLGSVRVVRAEGVRSSTTWGLLLGGIPILCWRPPWEFQAQGTGST